MDINNLKNSAKEMLEFIESKLTFPNIELNAANKLQYLALLNGFSYSRVDANATDAYNIDEADDDGYLRYSTEKIREAIQNVNNDEDTIIYTLIEQVKQQIKEYIEFLENGEFDEDMENNAWLSVTLQNIAAVFNVANAAAGGKKTKKTKKSRKTAKKSARKTAKKSSRKTAKKSARKTAKKSSRKH